MEREKTRDLNPQRTTDNWRMLKYSEIDFLKAEYIKSFSNIKWPILKTYTRYVIILLKPQNKKINNLKRV